MSDEKKDTTITKETPKPVKGAGKGMSPIKGYNYKNYIKNYDYIFRKTSEKKEK